MIGETDVPPPRMFICAQKSALFLAHISIRNSNFGGYGKVNKIRASSHFMSGVLTLKQECILMACHMMIEQTVRVLSLNILLAFYSTQSL